MNEELNVGMDTPEDVVARAIERVLRRGAARVLLGRPSGYSRLLNAPVAGARR